eukprot:536547_1
MSFDSSSTIIEESSSEVIYSSLDSCNSISNCKEEKSSDPYVFVDTDVSFIHKLNEEVYGKPNNINTIPLPEISTIELEEIIGFLFHTNNDNNENDKPIIHLIMNYFYPTKYINIYFVTLNNLTNTNMSSLKLLMYKDDTVNNLQKMIALKFNVSADHLILCEFWKSILTKLRYEKISMIQSTDQIIAYYMPSYIKIKEILFDNFTNKQLSYTSLIHQCHNFIDDNEESLSSLHFGLYNYPYFDKTVTKHRTSYSMEYEPISELSKTNQHVHFIIPPSIDENDIEEKPQTFSKLQTNDMTDIVNIGIPMPLMLPKQTVISTELIIQQCEMILKPYLKQWKNNKMKPYDLYILTKNTIYCGICGSQDNAFCNGCKLSKYKEINTRDLDFVISVRWIDEDGFNSFDQTVFTLINK